jgi:hypothetical protein
MRYSVKFICIIFAVFSFFLISSCKTIKKAKAKIMFDISKINNNNNYSGPMRIWKRRDVLPLARWEIVNHKTSLDGDMFIVEMLRGHCYMIDIWSKKSACRIFLTLNGNSELSIPLKCSIVNPVIVSQSLSPFGN